MAEVLNYVKSPQEPLAVFAAEVRVQPQHRSCHPDNTQFLNPCQTLGTVGMDNMRHNAR
jgi:hypothetical protein